MTLLLIEGNSESDDQEVLADVYAVQDEDSIEVILGSRLTGCRCAAVFATNPR